MAALALDATRRALADAGLAGRGRRRLRHRGRDPRRAGARRRDRPPPRCAATGPSAPSSGIAGSGTVGAPMLAELAIEAGLADVVVSYYGINLSARGAGGAYAVPRRRRGQGRVRDAVRLLRPARLLRRRGGPLPARVRAHQRAARCGGRGRPRQHAERTPNALRREPLTLDELPRRPDRRRPAAQARLLPRQRRRRRLRDDEPRAGPRPAPPAGRRRRRRRSAPSRSPRRSTSARAPTCSPRRPRSAARWPSRAGLTPGRRRRRRDLRLLHDLDDPAARGPRLRRPKGEGAAFAASRRPRAGRRACRSTPTAGCCRSRTPSAATTSSRPSASCAASEARPRCRAPRSPWSPGSAHPSTPPSCSPVGPLTDDPPARTSTRRPTIELARRSGRRSTAGELVPAPLLGLRSVAVVPRRRGPRLRRRRAGVGAGRHDRRGAHDDDRAPRLPARRAGRPAVRRRLRRARRRRRRPARGQPGRRRPHPASAHGCGPPSSSSATASIPCSCSTTPPTPPSPAEAAP